MLVVKLGGSLVQKSLTEMNPKIFDLIDRLVSLNTKFVVCVGGGKVTRLFLGALEEHGILDTTSLHEVGSRAVDLQAEYVKNIIPRDGCFPHVINSYAHLADALEHRNDFQYFVGGALKLGVSSDFGAVEIASAFGTKSILRLSDVDYVYSGDPDVYKDAQPILKMNWNEYLDLIGNPELFQPGSSFPVDPVAAKKARENKISIFFTSLDKILASSTMSRFDGTVIESD